MKVTFCVTCYDGDVHLLQGRLLSICSEQTVQPDEILVITSGTGSGPIPWDENKPSLAIKSFEQRKLPGGARNQGGKFATGDVVCFCDVDDPIHPQKCEIVKKIFENNPNVDALIHAYKFNSQEFEPYDSSNIEIEQITEVDPRWEKEQNYVFDPQSKGLPRTNIVVPSGNPAHHGHLSCKKEIFDTLKYREEMWVGEDGDFCQSIVKSQYKLFYTPLVLINYIT